ncbi:MAG TPA: M20/M25/M40 family metallo-hydrolase [Candidatus Nanopelagicaceae bacterium]|nr:M20/M25/M40 family metallo-hydrolase [Candidatus Nanopelagicaceae bacterium]
MPEQRRRPDAAAMIDDVRQLVKISSPTSELESVAKAISAANRQLLDRVGSEGEIKVINGRPLLHWGSAQPAVLLLCHLDTVWPHGSFTPDWEIAGDRMRGPGVFDMKAGFVQGIHAIASLLPELNEKLDQVALIATSDEETGSASSQKYLEETAASARAVFVLEASLAGKLKTARSGTSMYRLEVLGVAVHAGLEPEKGINATLEISYVIPLIAALSKPDIGTTVTPTVLQSGTTLNTVPGHAVLDVDVRAKSAAEQIRVDSQIRTIAGLRGEFRWSGGINRPPFESTASASLYELAEKVASELGLPPVGQANVGGASDGNFTAALGIPTIDGMGAVGEGAHAPGEWASIKGMVERSELLAEMIRALL